MNCKYCDTVHPKKEIGNPHYCIARMEEAKEKLEDEIERLTAENAGLREVEDSLQKEIKRLDRIIVETQDGDLIYLKEENKGLKEYSESRDESISVYVMQIYVQQEIKELKEELLQWGKAWEMYEKEYFELTKEKVKLKERLKGIEEVYKRQNKGGDGGGANSFANDCWQAIKKACEVKE
jgi:chromosome segregation ATPase